MNDIQRSRRPATRSPRGSRESNQLGELQFSDWYEIPVFEPDDDELTEEIATGGHGPRRLMARAKLARDARRAKRRPEWDAPMRRSVPPAPAAAPASETATQPEPVTAATATAAAATAPAETKPTTKPAAAKATAAERVAPKPAATEPAAPAVAEPTPQIDPAPAPAEEPAARPVAKQVPAPIPAEEPEPAKRPVRAKKPAPAPTPAPAPAMATSRDRDEDNWITSGPALTEESMQLDLDRESVWRRRLNTFLDRWAASEMAVAHRLDDSLERVMSPNLPKSIPDILAAATKRGGSR